MNNTSSGFMNYIFYFVLSFVELSKIALVPFTKCVASFLIKFLPAFHDTLAILQITHNLGKLGEIMANCHKCEYSGYGEVGNGEVVTGNVAVLQETLDMLQILIQLLKLGGIWEGLLEQDWILWAR